MVEYDVLSFSISCNKFINFEFKFNYAFWTVCEPQRGKSSNQKGYGSSVIQKPNHFNLKHCLIRLDQGEEACTH